ncbi:uncharacterized protein [Engystomops pustulosus]|uniref:uncharacterized protein n=1 Tax=Engystomops pustulosus TaxID=76066 RepID=UPI003AFB3002
MSSFRGSRSPSPHTSLNVTLQTIDVTPVLPREPRATPTSHTHRHGSKKYPRRPYRDYTVDTGSEFSSSGHSRRKHHYRHDRYSSSSSGSSGRNAARFHDRMHGSRESEPSRYRSKRSRRSRSPSHRSATSNRHQASPASASSHPASSRYERPTSSAPHPSISRNERQASAANHQSSDRGQGTSPTPSHHSPQINPSAQPAQLTASGPINHIWIVGHSFVHWAERRAAVRPCGQDLGIPNARVHWRGSRGMRWSKVLAEVVQISQVCREPAVLIIHAGGNDLGQVKLGELVSLMKQDLSRFPSFFNSVVLAWSEIIPRCFWRGARDYVAIERARKSLNIRISKHVATLGGVSFRHKDLEGDNRHLLIGDGVHLNPIGTDIFLLGLQELAEKAIALGRVGGRSRV